MCNYHRSQSLTIDNNDEAVKKDDRKVASALVSNGTCFIYIMECFCSRPVLRKPFIISLGLIDILCIMECPVVHWPGHPLPVIHG